VRVLRPERRETAQLRILLVDPTVRGQRPVEQCVRFARNVGYQRMVLWTNDPLAAARRVYLKAGFQLAEQEPHSSFSVDLIGQSYTIDLATLDVPAPEAGR
jgi:GNAT superfamily N-acetyltransferase